MPNKLYLLRMNNLGTQVQVEEYELAEYPVLSNWFKEKRQNGYQAEEHFKERELVGRAFGEERLVSYTLYKEMADREIFTVSNTLEEYHSCVEKTEQKLSIYGEANVKHKESKENIALCSFSDTFYVYDRPFIKLVYRLGNHFRTDAIFTEYDIPCWKLEFLHQGGISVHRRKELIDEEKSFEEWVEKNYTLPDKVMSNEVSGITRAYTVGHNIPVDGDVIFIAVSEPKINFKGVRIRLTLPKYIIEMIDSQASAQNISRSDVISQAIVHWCEYKNQDDEPEEEINNIDMF